MANQDAPFGLRPIGRIGGTQFNGGQNRYRIAANYGTAIFQGDMVAQVTGGTVEIHADGGTVPIVGVFNGCEYTDPTTGKVTFSNHYPGSIVASDIVANVIDDPQTLFLIDADATFTRAGLFTNYSVTNVSTGGTGTSLPLKAIDISQDPDNSDVATANANIKVVIENHIFGLKGAGLA